MSTSKSHVSMHQTNPPTILSKLSIPLNTTFNLTSESQTLDSYWTTSYFYSCSVVTCCYQKLQNFVAFLKLLQVLSYIESFLQSCHLLKKARWIFFWSNYTMSDKGSFQLSGERYTNWLNWQSFVTCELKFFFFVDNMIEWWIELGPEFKIKYRAEFF